MPDATKLEWLVEYVDADECIVYARYETINGAIPFLHKVLSEGKRPRLYRETPITLTIDVGGEAPVKAPRKRRKTPPPALEPDPAPPLTGPGNSAAGEPKEGASDPAVSAETSVNPGRFWAGIARPPEGCWSYTTQPKRDGYCYHGSRGKLLAAHRVAWALTNGVIPPGKLVLHVCDNRICVRPDHLYLGTHQDNMDDMVRRGRVVATGPKLNKSAAHTIRQRRQAGEPAEKIAAEYGLTARHVNKIVAGFYWPEEEDIGAASPQAAEPKAELAGQDRLTAATAGNGIALPSPASPVFDCEARFDGDPSCSGPVRRDPATGGWFCTIHIEIPEGHRREFHAKHRSRNRPVRVAHAG